MDSKTLYIIAGCNDAGKTSASVSILPQILDCKDFVNADEIAVERVDVDKKHKVPRDYCKKRRGY